MYSMTIRKIDDKVAAALKGMAKEKNMSMEAIARKILSDYVMDPELRAAEDKYITFSDNMINLYAAIAQESKDVIEQNNYMLKKLIGVIEQKGM